MRRRAAAASGSAATALLGAALLPAGAGAGWNQPVGGDSPINEATNRSAQGPSLASVGGVPFVAWSELDGTNSEIRVARLNAAGNDWEQPRSSIVVSGGGINQSDSLNAFSPSIASIGGVPHVAWIEQDTQGNFELRVARLTSTLFGPRWLQPWSGASDTSGGINHSTTQNAIEPSLGSVGGVPHVAWTEVDGSNNEMRVSRLNGNVWEEVGGGASPINQDDAENAASASLTSVGGVAHVAWSELDGATEQVRVSRLNGAGTAWEQVVGGASPINHDGGARAGSPSLIEVGGVSHVAFTELDGINAEVRVSRLNAAGTAWEELVGGPSPINRSSDENASEPSLIAIDGVPYVAWNEFDGTNREVRVSRLNAAGTAWEELVGGASPINHASDQSVLQSRLTAVAGVPYVAWDETDGITAEARVSRLEPEFGGVTATATATGATLRTDVRTFGLPYPVGFQFGPALEQETSAEPAPAGGDEVTVIREVGGLQPSTTHQFRPFATAGVPAPRVLGGTGAFTTLATGVPPGGSGADLLAAVFSNFRISPSVFLAAGSGGAAQRRAVGARVSYVLSEPAAVTFRVQRCRRPTPRNRGRRPCRRFVTLRGSFVHQGAAGPNRLRFTGRLRGRKLRTGRHRLLARPVDAAGNASPIARKGFRIAPRRVRP